MKKKISTTKKKKRNVKRLIFNFVFGFVIFFITLLPFHWFFKFLIIAFMLWFSHITNVESYFKKKNNIISCWFGPPGAGKTTLAACIAQIRHDSGSIVLSNVDIANTYKIDPVQDLGTYSTWFDGNGCTVIIDEATLDFDNRGFKSFSAANKNFFALFRHDNTEVICLSQAIDVDKRIRDRSALAYYLQRSIISSIYVHTKVALKT